MIISLKKLFLLLLLFFFTQATLERSKDDARDPCYYTRRVKEAINIRLLPDNINRDSGIEIPEAWMPTIKKHNNRRAVRQRTAEGANHRVKTARIEMHQSEPLKND